MKVRNLHHPHKRHNCTRTIASIVASLAMLLGIPLASTGVASAETIGGDPAPATTQGQPAKPQQPAIPQQVTKLQQSTVPQQPAIPQARPGIIGTRAATCTQVSGTPNKHFGFTWHISQDGDECVLHATNLQSITSNRPSSFSDAIVDASGFPSDVTKFVADSPLPAISVDFNSLFEDLSALKTVDLTNFANVKPTSTNSMFHRDTSLTSLDLTGLNTGNVTDMVDMFGDDGNLTDITFGTTFDTGNVTDMNSMFSFDYALTSLNLTGLDTHNVTDMNSMFNGDSKLTSLNLTGLNTGNVTDMNNMFSFDYALTSLNLTGLDTHNVTDMHSMFNGDSKLTSLNLTGLNTGNVTDMHSMFNGDSKLADITFGTTFDTGKVTDMNSMFNGDSALTSLNLTGLNTGNVTDMNNMFSFDYALTSLNLTGLNTGKVTDMHSMFNGDSKLTSLNLTGLNTGNVTDMHSMFNGDSKLTDITFGTTFDTGKVTDMNNMFSFDYALTSLDIGGFDTGNVTDMNGMFASDRALTSLDIGGFDTGKVTDMRGMFDDTLKLNDITVGADTRVAPFNAVGTAGDTNLDWRTVDQSGNWTGTWSGPFQDIFDASKTPRTETTEYRSAPRYTLSFTAGQGTGSVNPIGRLHEGDKPTLPAPTGMTAPTGKQFAGWKDGNTVYQAGDTYTMPNHDVTLNAAWTSIDYTVHFDANNGTGTMTDMTGQHYQDQITLPSPSFTAPAGMHFQGWLIGSTVYQAGRTYTMPAHNVVSLAMWSSDAYTVRFAAGQGTGTMSAMSNLRLNSTVTLPNNTFTAPSDSHFKDWTDGTSTYNPGDTYNVSHNVTLTAEWAKNSHTGYILRFRINGFTATMDGNAKHDEGDIVTLPSASAFSTPRGERFACWSTGSTCPTTRAATYTMPDHDVTLNAVWTREAPHTVRFDANNGTGTMPDMTGQLAGDGITLPANSLVRAGYDFTGWNTKADGTGTAYPDKANLTMPDSDLTLYAQWSQRQPAPGTPGHPAAPGAPASTTTPGGKPAALSNAPTGATPKANGALSDTGSNTLAPLCTLALLAISGITLLALRRKTTNRRP